MLYDQPLSCTKVIFLSYITLKSNFISFPIPSINKFVANSIFCCNIPRSPYKGKWSLTLLQNSLSQGHQNESRK